MLRSKIFVLTILVLVIQFSRLFGASMKAGSFVVRKAEVSDLEVILLIGEMKGLQYEKYQPVFHRLAKGSKDIARPYLKHLIEDEKEIVLVGTEQGKVCGCIHARLKNPLPVYDLGGKIADIDEFMVQSPDLWKTLGKQLLNDVMAVSAKRGAVLGSVVCGPEDFPKKQMLSRAGYSAALEWHVRSIKSIQSETNILTVRAAKDDDLEAILSLNEKKARQYERYEPVFYRLSNGSRDENKNLISHSVSDKKEIMLVGPKEGEICAFAHASLVEAPPVYNPGGQVVYVDELTVKSPDVWETLGRQLLDQAISDSVKRGAVLGIVACGSKDLPKKKVLRDAGYSVASEWHVKSLGPKGN